MERPVVLSPALAEQFKEALKRNRAILFSAPCGYGKTTAVRQLLAGQTVCMRSALEQGFTLPGEDEDWETLLIDDMQAMSDPEDGQALAGLIRDNPHQHFVLLTRGTIPSWAVPFQIAGVMVVFGVKELTLDRETTGKLLQKYGATCSDQQLSMIQEQTKGYALAIALLARRLGNGENYRR